MERRLRLRESEGEREKRGWGERAKENTGEGGNCERKRGWAGASPREEGG